MEKAREEAAKAVKEAAMADSANSLTTEIAVRYFLISSPNVTFISNDKKWHLNVSTNPEII